MSLIYASSAIESAANPWPAASQAGDIALAHVGLGAGNPIDELPEWATVNAGRTDNNGLTVYSRTVTGTETTMGEFLSAGPIFLAIFRDAQLGASRSAGNNVGDQAKQDPQIVPDVTAALNGGYHLATWRFEKEWDGVAFAGYTVHDATTDYGLVTQPATTAGGYGGEAPGGQGGSSEDGIVSVILEPPSTPPGPGLPDASFDKWPQRHPRVIDVARKLKSAVAILWDTLTVHINDDTRHIDVVDPATLAPAGRDFLMYSEPLGAWVPIAPFAYGELGFEGTYVQAATVGYEILAPTGMAFGPHYLLSEPSEGRVQYDGEDFRTARLDVNTTIEITNNNTNIAIAVFLNGVLAYERGGVFAGNQTGTILDVRLETMFDISNGDIIDVRIDTNLACEIQLHSIMTYAWPQAAGHIP